ncbi:esterase/lipase family protein [Aeromicrobium chenweiae]|uniref:Alpha/beta hydrolase n=1 Tax=Aeromicrobium chenweiae TaxID=2079793 RepID=A0A2S0WK25_9ACTN|nr:alpha/beta hydrolase [Aeromicrobium chenweiae]AWB91681.1 alpha/beta hydrolase [Aeromicrobium chenweiae]TGN32521.1 cutinase family protein [Aeromicrobium chenweiae]
MPAEPARTTDVAALALDYGDRLIVGTARDLHRAVSARFFRATRVVGGRVPESLNDAVVTSVYGAISGTLRVSSGSVRALAARGVGRPIESSRRGRLVVAAVNGLIGDELRTLGDPQAITMAARVDGEDVPTTSWQLGEAFPGATSHPVIFVHGLCENDESWSNGAKAHGTTYPERVAAETDGTPVLIRYNTGLHISENGQHLDTLIQQVVENWPVAVTRITLVGYSMGGLVARAATNHATAAGQTWQHLVRDVVCLGTPHTGANLEKAAHLGSRLLTFWPESAPFSKILEHRSAGIVDLRHGYITRDEWEGQDLTGQWGLDRIAAAPLPHAEYHFVAATLGASQGHPLSSVLGDLLVHFSSATGVGRAGPVVDGARFEYLASAHHFALLHHPQVGDWLVGWLNARTRSPKALPAPRRA